MKEREGTGVVKEKRKDINKNEQQDNAQKKPVNQINECLQSWCEDRHVRVQLHVHAQKLFGFLPW